MLDDRSKMRNGDMPLLDRIDVALRRVTSGEGHTRVPAEATDPDVVLFDCKREIERLRESLRGLLAVTSSKASGTGLIVGAEDRHAAAIKQARAALAQLVADPRDPPDRGGGAGGTGRAA